MTTRFTYAVSTMGCKANLTDSQDIEARLQGLGGAASADPDCADVFILNTCTVTDQADKEASYLLKRKKSPLVVATGCLAEVNPQGLRDLRPDMVVVRNSAKNELDQAIGSWLQGEEQKLWQGDRAAWHTRVDHVNASALTAKAEQRTRAFLKVQDGCNAFCSYCIIPFARGRSRSIAAQQIVQEIQALLDAGVQEVVLTAIHAADYIDGHLDFTGLVQMILQQTQLPRLRLTSLDPAEITPGLLNLMAENPRLCAHFHVSLQSGSTEVLRGMKRAYDAEASEGCLKAIYSRVEHSFVGMDIIAGFPGESDQNFDESFALLQRTPWTKLHVFPYSVRKGTAAERMVQSGAAVPSATIKVRAAKLRALSEERLQKELQKRLGKVMEILVENKELEHEGQRYATGHSRSYFKVAVRGSLPANRLQRVKVRAVLGKEYLLGEAF